MLDLDYKEVAERYGGNKQKIAQAAAIGALGPEGPLLAVTAGMYIDRMRAAQMAERAPQQTVAQQVLAPQGGMPAAPPTTPPQGLGAIAPEQLGAPSVPAASAPAPAPDASQSPMGMADGGYLPPYASGGLTDVPLPAGMFDEPSNGGFDDGYAGGGLVAFARGGMSDYYDDVEYAESRGRQNAVSPAGARGVMQLMPGTARNPGFGVRAARDNSEAENRRMGRDYLDAMFKTFGDEDLALMAYNWGPGNVRKWLKAGRPESMVPKETKDYVRKVKGGDAPLPERNVQTAEGRRGSLMDQMGVVEDIYGKLPEDTGRTKATEYYEKQLDPKEQEKERKHDMWATLAQIGASLASTDSPFFLQGVGQAIASALPGAEASRRERKKVERDAVNALSELYGMDRKEAKEKVAMAVDLRGIELGAEGAEVERKYRSEEAEKERAFRAEQAVLDRQTQKELAEVKMDKGLEALVSTNYNILKRRAETGEWKTTKGNKPNEDTIRYWAYQHALEQWNKYKTTQQPSLINPSDVGLQGGAGGAAPQVVTTNYGNM